MNLESKSPTINASAQEVYNFLNNVENFEKLMPDNISKFEILGQDKFVFALKGMPEIVLKKQEALPVSKIVLGAGGGKIDFSLTGEITELEENTSILQLTFSGDFNPMMAMMIKGPISKFLETLTTNISKELI